MHQVPIAIVGVSSLFPGSTDARGFFRDIMAARDLVTDVPPSHWLIEDYYDPDPKAPDKTYSRRGAFLGDVPFDPMAFGIPPSTIPATDSAQLLALMVTQRLLDDATGGRFGSMDRGRVSVILGVTSGQELLGTMNSRTQRPVWLKALRDDGVSEDQAQRICDRIGREYVPWQESSFPGLLGNVVAGRIANRFDLGGTNCVTDAACASTFAALSMGVNELATGQADLVLTGGVDAMNDIFMFMCFSKTPALSKSGDCRPFSDSADGTLLGEGMAMFALKRLDDAERDGDRVYAVIRGVGSSSDGRSKSVYAPVPEGQAKALVRAYEAAGYGPSTVELVEAHGTATKAGDAAEFAGLKLAFQDGVREDRQWCALGSVKSQIGHTKAAAGAAGLFKAVMALHHKVLPPTIKVDRPNPDLHIDESPFYLNTQARPWVKNPEHPRRASVSAFGFGGSNFHVTLEEYEGKAPSAYRFRAAVTELVLISAPAAKDLPARCAEIGKRAAREELADLARSSQEAFRATDEARLAIVASSADDLTAKIQQALGRLSSAPTTAFSTPTGVHFATGTATGDVVFVFPGQGSQYVGMGSDVAMEHDVAQRVWDEAANCVFDGEALRDVVFPKPVFDDEARAQQTRRLTATEWAQPAIATTSAALLSVLRAVGVRPSCVAGHSLGEVTALAAAGALSGSDLPAVARRRGELMRAASEAPGAMTAVPRPIDEVRALVDRLANGVVIANHNHPTQVVLSGPIEGIAQVEKELAGQGVSAKRLPVATAFHSPIVAPAAPPFAEYLAGIAVASPTIDVFSNGEAAPYPQDPAEIRALLAGEIARPVRFVEEVEAMWARGARVFVEVGPSAVLSDLVTRILGDRPHVAIPLDRKGKNGVTSMQEALGRLAVAGVSLDFAPLWASYAPIAPPKRPPAMTVNINGSNHAKPYPPKGGASKLPPPNPPKPEATSVIIRESVKSNHAPSDVRHAHVNGTPPSPARAAVLANPEPIRAAAIPEIAPQRPAAPAVAAPAPSAWIHAYQESQRQMTDAHTSYVRTMASNHELFLRTMEASFTGLSGIVAGPSAVVSDAVYTPSRVEAPAFAPLRVETPPTPAPVELAPARVQVASAPVAAVAVATNGSASTLAPQLAAPAVRAPQANAIDLEPLLLRVVADKTGYPAEMLAMHMELESDLGIDSIKRVEILSAMRAEAPGLPEVVASEMAALRTLGQIVGYMRERAGAGVAGEAVVTPAAAAPAIALEPLLLRVVADKTGYPAEMLGMHMELESDLGIDSIKRVEILSAMRAEAPGLPEVVASEMAALRTLGQIVGYMRERAGAGVAGDAVVTPAAAAPAIALEPLLLRVVADKTGYPAEMLAMHMELESDLGIDSIKRVEILSAMRAEAPGLPEVVASEMAALRTLGQIVGYMRERAGGSAAVDAAAPQAEILGAQTAQTSRIGRYTLAAREEAAPGLVLGGLLLAKKLVVTDEGTGIAPRVAQLLTARGIPAEVVGEVPAAADAVVFLGGLRAPGDIDAAVAVNHEAFHAAKAVARSFSTGGGTFVVVFDNGGDLGLSGRDPRAAWLAGVGALARTAAVEWPLASVKSIDLERGGRNADQLAGAIVEELLAGGTAAEVALSASGARVVPEVAEHAVVPAAGLLDHDSVVVASGGGRGVTAAALVALARQVKPRVVLLGRSALEEEPAACKGARDDAALKRALLEDVRANGVPTSPAELGAKVARIVANREIRTTLAAIDAAGGSARYLAVDVTDGLKLAAALDEVRREWGPISAIVHGAGVLADKRIEDKTPEQFQRVFDTKVKGLRALLDATGGDPLRVVALFSSVAARAGNLGQSDYAMANEVLNKVAIAERRRRGEGCVVKAIGWGPWEGGMVNPALKDRFEKMGVALIPLAEGADRFVAELAGSPSDIEIVIGGGAGGRAIRGADQPAVTAGAVITKALHPHLGDHRVGGRRVLPVAIAVEWMARAVREASPWRTACLHDIKVLRGIKLDRAEDRFLIRRLSAADGSLRVELASLEGALHYSARADFGSKPDGALHMPQEPALAPWDGRPVYDGEVLFHGPRFQMIQRVDGISAEGASAMLVGARALGWGADAMRTDPAIVDGALQLALLWARGRLGGSSLPMAIKALEWRAAGPVDGPVRAVVLGREVEGSRAVSDVWIADPQGAVIAVLRGIETIQRPSDTRAVSLAEAGSAS